MIKVKYAALDSVVEAECWLVIVTGFLWKLGSRAKHCAAVKEGFSWAESIKSDLHTHA